MRSLPAGLLRPCLLLTGAAACAQLAGNGNMPHLEKSFKQVFVYDHMAEARSYVGNDATYTAFVVSVPPQGTIEAALDHRDMGSMFVACYSQPQFDNVLRGSGDLRRSITRKVKFENSGQDRVTVYFVVSDIELRSTKADPYTLRFTRSWAKPEAGPAAPSAEPAAKQRAVPAN